MKRLYVTPIIAATAFLVTSCGTQIQMTEAVPAKLNMARGSKVAIAYKGYLPDKVGDELLSLMTKDGYYTFVSGNADYTISIQEHYGVVSTPSQYQVDFYVLQGDRGAVLYTGRTPEETRVGIPARLAKRIYETFAPHEKNLYVRVRGSKENPSVELGAKACQAGNWEQGEAYAKQALQQKPDDPEALFLMGVIERRKMNYALSTAYFARANTIKPSGKYKGAISKNKVMEQNDRYTMQQLAGE